MGEVAFIPWHVGKRQIYIIGSNRDGPLKIGISRDAWKRLDELQPGHPDKLRVFATFIVEPGREWLERAIHEQLAKFRMTGEWFRIPIELAMSAIWVEHCRHEISICPGSMGWYDEQEMIEDLAEGKKRGGS